MLQTSKTLKFVPANNSSLKVHNFIEKAYLFYRKSLSNNCAKNIKNLLILSFLSSVHYLTQGFTQREIWVPGSTLDTSHLRTAAQEILVQGPIGSQGSVPNHFISSKWDSPTPKILWVTLPFTCRQMMGGLFPWFQTKIDDKMVVWSKILDVWISDSGFHGRQETYIVWFKCVLFKLIPRMVIMCVPQLSAGQWGFLDPCICMFFKLLGQQS